MSFKRVESMLEAKEMVLAGKSLDLGKKEFVELRSNSNYKLLDELYYMYIHTNIVDKYNSNTKVVIETKPHCIITTKTEDELVLYIDKEMLETKDFVSILTKLTTNSIGEFTNINIMLPDGLAIMLRYKVVKDSSKQITNILKTSLHNYLNNEPLPKGISTGIMKMDRYLLDGDYFFKVYSKYVIKSLDDTIVHKEYIGSKDKLKAPDGITGSVTRVINFSASEFDKLDLSKDDMYEEFVDTLLKYNSEGITFEESKLLVTFLKKNTNRVQSVKTKKALTKISKQLSKLTVRYVVRPDDYEPTKKVEHERSSHYRRYKSGKVVKVRACTVNKGNIN